MGLSHATITAMNLKESLKQLEALGNEKMWAQNTRNGAGENQYGVRLGEIRKLAKKIRTNHEFALTLWETGNVEARLLITLVIQPKELSAGNMDRTVRSETFEQVADWFNAYVLKNHPDKETLRKNWLSPRSGSAKW